LKTRIGEARVAAFFKSPEDIRSHVVEALVRLAKEFENCGGRRRCRKRRREAASQDLDPRTARTCGASMKAMRTSKIS
jgi:hypothetical protein